MVYALAKMDLYCHQVPTVTIAQLEPTTAQSKKAASNALRTVISVAQRPPAPSVKIISV